MVSHPVQPAPPREYVRLHDPDCGLDGVIAIHSTALGPGAGGCRMWTYPDFDHALADAARLAEGMSYKNALAGLPFGGAKAVLRKPEGHFDRAALFRAFGRAVEDLGGRYVTAEDVGTSVADMLEVARTSRHVAGLPSTAGRAGGDPSPWTAKGVFESMRAAARFALGSDLAGLTIAVQGAGNVGGDLCLRLADAGARLIVADPNPVHRDRMRAIPGVEIVDVRDITLAQADIFAPCALGGALTPDTVRNLKAKLVCGAANNQLASSDVADLLMARGIAYVPDYIANAGGIISVSAEYLGEDESDVTTRVSQIAPRAAAVLARAAHEGRSPAILADELAKEIIAAAERVAA